MKVGDLVIVASLGEIKAYRANPRTPEAEAGLKPSEVKLDFIRGINVVEAHKKLSDLITDTTGTVNKAGFLNRAASGEKHTLKDEIYKEAVKSVAEDIDLLIEEENKTKVFLSLPKTIVNDVLPLIKNRDKIFRIVEKDLLKTDKNKLIDEFKPEILK
ncbi:host attachment protein [Caminibacter pacificus]|uniref:Host attachment protein n=1 Tax=Caminibacter pacificus TaxID=1424653 RepID=A0AAJ4RBA1_9BACT|nr:host attachment protein [Caminibacter pacificus]NPA87171.1 host attachment protein [Campylobacterota bacterium]QCI29193.1 host attachment protein [Caminibacter pacificus]ROR38837.1 protein required for attachment to host cells [Caminibacter pacificus]